MVDCCANPACRAAFRQLSGGDLYALEPRSADTEFFWLCAACASRFSLYLNAVETISLRPRGHGRPPYQLHPGGDVRLVSHSARRMPWRSTMPAGERIRLQNPEEPQNPGEWRDLEHLPVS